MAKRSKVEEGLTRASTSLQGGAKRGLGPTAHLLRVRVRQANAKEHKRAFIVVTMDIESAFYRAIRQLLISSESGNDRYDFLARAFQLFGLDPGQIDMFNDALEQESIMDQTGICKPVQRIIQSSFQGSWRKLQQSDKCLHTAAGSKPGSPLADVLFSLIMWKFLKGVSQAFSEDAQTDASTLTWIDDVACTCETSAEEAGQRAAHMLQVLHDQATRLALKPSLKRGKTEAMICMRGPHSREVKRHLEAEGAVIHFNTREGPKVVERMEECGYLRAILDGRGSLMPEIRQATALAFGAVRPMARKVLQQRAIRQEIRKSIVQALAISKATYSCGTWGHLRDAEERQWTTRIHQIQRTICPWEKDKHVSDLQMRAKHEWPHPKEYLQYCYSRLRLLAMLKEWADDTYLQPFFEQDDLKSGCNWTRMILEDIQVIWPTLQHGGSFKQLMQSLPTGAGKEIKKRIRKHMKKAAQDQRREATTPPKQVDETTEEHGQMWCCYTCGKQWASRTAWAVHNRTVHGVLSQAAFFAPTATCFHCGRCYHTRSRLIQHLSFSSTNCLAHIQCQVEPLTLAQVHWFNAQDIEARRETNLDCRAEENVPRGRTKGYR